MNDLLSDFDRAASAKPAATFPGFVPYSGDMIEVAGAYRDVPNERYHGAEICPGPSVSGTGLKILAAAKGARTQGQTPRHFWEQSSLNPARKLRTATKALDLGQAFHDALLLPDRYDNAYHVLPEGFSRAKSKAMAAEIAEADAAEAAGMTCLSVNDCTLINAMVDAVTADPLIAPFIGNGEAEVTLAWQDSATGIWLRARPDWLMADLSAAMNFKTAADASYTGFSRAIAQRGYAQSAALELDGYAAIFGVMPSRFYHPVIEKPTAWTEGDYIPTALWELPEEDIERGRWLNRMAINTFADCLATKQWPGYTPEPEPCGLPGYARHVIDNGGAAEPGDDEINA